MNAASALLGFGWFLMQPVAWYKIRLTRRNNGQVSKITDSYPTSIRMEGI